MKIDQLEKVLLESVKEITINLNEKLAKDGLVVLQRVLDVSGASRSLGQYDLYSHISGDSVIFEIIVNSDVVIATDEMTQKAISEEMSKWRKNTIANITKSFIMSERGPQVFMHDARNEVAGDTYIDNPSGMDMGDDGKLSLTLERSTRKTKSGEFMMPKGELQGLLGKYMEKLNKVIAKNFADELTKVINQ
jgi:hypothetical protein